MRRDHETKTEAIRKALLERQVQLRADSAGSGAGQGLKQFMEHNIWPAIPATGRGRGVTREEEDEILG